MTKQDKKELKIIMFGVGFVVLTTKEDMDYDTRNNIAWLDVTRGFIIRNWGTTNGIGELTAKGPTDQTILDAIPHHVHIPTSVIYMILDVCPEAANNFNNIMKESEKKLLL
jgi:hypothetical protein